MESNELPAAVTGKPRELQGFLNRIAYHPAARRLAILLARTPATPNMVSVFGAMMVCATGVLYALVGTPVAIGIGFALHLLWHVVDGADGDLARMTGRASPRGEVVDGLCDYGGHIVLYLLLGYALQQVFGPLIWVVVVGAGVSRIVQSVFAESSRRSYQWWVYGVPWIQNNRAAGSTGMGGALARFYLKVSHAVTGPTETINALVASAEPDPAERQRIARLAKETGRRTLLLPGLLGANPRTILLGLSMIAGSSVWFFLIELTLLNIVLAVAIVQQRINCTRLMALIARGRD
ncbi:CDP-alcohol phosphatidyltransferase [Sphingomonas sp. CL5.1]|uniref:CDP-alcohol phosphatidyltransferase family protein n=1 Tax=Sphingomonas sp. CL5.1 TaxID=2653203 RepID=UPI00158427E8|nr:CDP-alcohol phosphatidyltransferase family protein [Sphingomonas sp. CL5.1]QKS00717.1 CDP-alcohol phosphatidyltransferase [Sphingomonas sp. CL5.1]